MKLASIETITSLVPHPNADTLDIARVLGWECIVKRGQFKEGDRAVFIPIDTILPDEPWSAFLKKGDKPVRLVTVKLRGKYSQGLLLQLDVLTEHVREWQVGADVGGILGVKKYEKEVPACLSGQVKCPFPLYLAPKTDEDNGLSNPDLVAHVLSNPCYATLKLDGSSCTLVVEDGQLVHVCSRNMSLIDDGKNAFWRVAKKGQYSGFTGVIQGELMGPGIQGNQLELSEPELYVFQVKSQDEWIEGDILAPFARGLGFKVIPTVCSYYRLGTPLEDLQKVADSVVLPNDKPAEGIVVRTKEPKLTGNGRPLGFKLINRNYKDT